MGSPKRESADAVVNAGGPAWAHIRDREALGSQPWTAPPPPARPPAGLLQMTAREAEILDLGFLWACQRAGADPNNPKVRNSVVEGLVADTSQNPERKPWGLGLPRLTRTCKPYLYSWARRIRPGEAFEAYGWRRPALHTLSDAECWDLLGDSMALPTLAAALVSLLGAAGEGLPGLFAASAPGAGSAA